MIYLTTDFEKIDVEMLDFLLCLEMPECFVKENWHLIANRMCEIRALEEKQIHVCQEHLAEGNDYRRLLLRHRNVL